MYFDTKSYLKSTRNHTAKHTIKQSNCASKTQKLKLPLNTKHKAYFSLSLQWHFSIFTTHKKNKKEPLLYPYQSGQILFDLEVKK
jgi:hypothetical protein